MSPRRAPRVWRLLARFLLPGGDGRAIRADLDEGYARDRERGRSRTAARRRYVRNLLGSSSSLARSRVAGLWTRGAVLDVKLGLRMLRKQPLLTLVAMLALGLGIPSSLAFGHYLDQLISPLPVPEGERVLGIRNWDLDRGPIGASVHEYERWREALTSFSALGATRSYSVNVHDGNPGLPPVRGSEITASAFDLLRVAPILGRPFGARDEVRGADDVVILGEDLWSARFARDPDIIGRTVRIGRGLYSVVGVMPADFRFPSGDQVWFPVRASAAEYPFGEGPRLDVFGRLVDGVREEQADLEVSLLTERMALDRPEYRRKWGQAVPLALLLSREQSSFADHPEVLAIQAIIFALLFVVCGNVGLLVLARTAHRAAEMAVRTALGASRVRIVSQVFVETVVLVILSTGLGLVGAELVARWITRIAAMYEFMPYWVDLTLGPAVVVQALALGLVSAVIAGVIPALRATGTRIQPRLQRVAAGATMRFGLGSSVLIVAEILLSVGFLATGSVLVRSTYRDVEGKLGFEPERYLRATLLVPSPLERQGNVGIPDPIEEARYDPVSEFGAHVAATQGEFLRLLSEDDEVRGAAISRHSFGQTPFFRRITLEPMGEGEAVAPRVMHGEVGVDYFRALRRPILEGRDFSRTDLDGEIVPVIVNESFVRDVLGGSGPIGRRFQTTVYTSVREPETTEYEVVGLVGAFGLNPLNPDRDAGYYSPMALGANNRLRFVVETADPAGFIPRLREILAAVDPEAVIHEPLPVAVALRNESRITQLASAGVMLMAGIAFLLSVTGLYALMSFTVAQRKREIGLRSALGARPARIVSAIGRRAVLQLLLGLLLAIPWAWTLLDQVSGEEGIVEFAIPSTIAVTLLGTALVGALACAIPTLRGLRIQPIEALRDR